MTVSSDRPSKPSVWRAFAQPSAWTMFFFGFASGMPFLLVAGTLAELGAHFAAVPPRGEIVVVVAGADEKESKTKTQ